MVGDAGVLAEDGFWGFWNLMSLSGVERVTVGVGAAPHLPKTQPPTFFPKVVLGGVPADAVR